jgi:Flp pilus assembly pilin Flp
VFYLVIVIYAGFYAHVTCFMPESLDEQAMKQARMKAAQGTRPSIWQTFNIFSALSIISKAKPRHISKYAVPILAAIQFLMAVLGQPPIVLYAMLMFKWTAYENGLLASLISLVRFIVIIVVLPQVVTRLQKYWQQQTSSDSTTSEDDTKIRHRILFDTTMVRVGLGIQMFGLLAIAIATTETAFIWALVIECLSVISQPSVRSLYTTLVEPSEVGALCGAQAVLESSASKSFLQKLSKMLTNFFFW